MSSLHMREDSAGAGIIFTMMLHSNKSIADIDNMEVLDIHTVDCRNQQVTCATLTACFIYNRQSQNFKLRPNADSLTRFPLQLQVRMLCMPRANSQCQNVVCHDQRLSQLTIRYACNRQISIQHTMVQLFRLDQSNNRMNLSSTSMLPLATGEPRCPAAQRQLPTRHRPAQKSCWRSSSAHDRSSANKSGHILSIKSHLVPNNAPCTLERRVSAHLHGCRTASPSGMPVLGGHTKQRRKLLR